MREGKLDVPAENPALLQLEPVLVNVTLKWSRSFATNVAAMVAKLLVMTVVGVFAAREVDADPSDVVVPVAALYQSSSKATLHVFDVLLFHM